MVQQTAQKPVTQAEFNKRVEMEHDWIKRHEYENDSRKAWSLAQGRIAQEYIVQK